MSRTKGIALAGALAGVGAGVVAEHLVLRRRRRSDPEGREPLGQRRGARRRSLELLDGGSLFIEEAGPTLTSAAVFVHGSALRSDMWHYQLEGLDGHRLIFYDLRGHGRSQPKGASSYSIPTLAGDLATVIDDAGIQQVVVVGHSIGGMIALELCRARPELVGDSIRGLVLVNTTYRPAVETLVGGAVVSRLERLTRHPLELVGSQHANIDRLRRIVTPSDALFWTLSFAAFGPNPSPQHVDFTYDMLAETPTGVLFELVKSIREFDVKDHLGLIKVPALVVGGTHDRLTIAEASEHLATHLPKAELRLLEGCGHMTPLEQHHEFNTMLEEFLSDVFGRREER